MQSRSFPARQHRSGSHSIPIIPQAVVLLWGAVEELLCLDKVWCPECSGVLWDGRLHAVHMGGRLVQAGKGPCQVECLAQLR
jgi:hypothetical protein